HTTHKPQPKEAALGTLHQREQEVPLTQASDVLFMIKSEQMEDYASRRIKSHLAQFHRLKEQVESGVVDQEWLESIEKQDNIFREIETFAAFRKNGDLLVSSLNGAG